MKVDKYLCRGWRPVVVRRQHNSIDRFRFEIGERSIDIGVGRRRLYERACRYMSLLLEAFSRRAPRPMLPTVTRGCLAGKITSASVACESENSSKPNLLLAFVRLQCGLSYALAAGLAESPNVLKDTFWDCWSGNF